MSAFWGDFGENFLRGAPPRSAAPRCALGLAAPHETRRACAGRAVPQITHSKAQITGPLRDPDLGWGAQTRAAVSASYPDRANIYTACWPA